MTTRRSLGVLTLGLLVILPGCRSGPMQAQAEPAAPPWSLLPVAEPASGSVEIVLYQGGWALVSDTRLLSLQEGAQVVRFPHLGIQTEEQGSYLQLPASVLRRRFRFDVQNPTRLLERYDGMSVDIVTSTGSVRATVVMTESGPMYRIDDRLYTDPPGKVALPILAGLALTPSLEWIVNAPGAWTGLATASYIARQLGWHSSYNLLTNAEQSTGNLQHWANISNHSGGKFGNAQLTLVAGDVRRATQPPVPMMPYGGMRAYAMDAAVQAEPYAARHQYRLPERMTLERGAEERMILAEANGVAISRLFQVGGSIGLYPMPQELPQKARLRLEIQNTQAAGLGKPLPSGTVTVYTPNKQGVLAIAGQTTIPDTPVAQKLILDLGEAFDVTAQRRQTLYQVRADGHQVGYALTLKNEQDQPVTVEVLESLPGDWTISNASHDYEKLSANQVRFRVAVPAKSEVKLSYEAFIKKQP